MATFDEVVTPEVHYCGFVYVDTSDSKPSFYHINIASMMFDKKSIKQTRTLNPLFAQEHESALELLAVGECLKFNTKDKHSVVIMEIPIRKIELVSCVEKGVYVVVLRAKGGKYLCHRLKMKSAKEASEVTQRLNIMISRTASGSSLPTFNADVQENYDVDAEVEDHEDHEDHEEVVTDMHDDDQNEIPIMRMLSKKGRSDSQRSSQQEVRPAEEEEELPLQRMLSKKNRSSSDLQQQQQPQQLTQQQQQAAAADYFVVAPLKEALYEDLPASKSTSRPNTDGLYMEPIPVSVMAQQQQDFYSSPGKGPMRGSVTSASVMVRGGVPVNPSPPPRSATLRSGSLNMGSAGGSSTLRRSSAPAQQTDAIRTADYYFDTMPRREAELRLRGQAPGTFLVRLAESHQGYALSMTLFNGLIQHFKIWQDPQAKFRIAGNEGRGFSTLTDLIEHYRWSPITDSGDFCVRPCPRADSDPHVYEMTVAEQEGL